ncbi:MAG: hypothetical protein RI967_1975 [Planctomycetota bacterium]
MHDTRRPRPLSSAAGSLAPLALALFVAGCDRPASSPTPPPPPPTEPAEATPADAASAQAPAKKSDVKISKEYWTETGKLKYFYELRKDANGKWKRNGIGRAYFSSGEMEREGTYRDGVRVGTWTYFKTDGTVDRVEERGDGDGKAE